MAYRASTSAAGVLTASFDVTLADGYELTSWDVSFGHEFNRNGVTYAVTVGGFDGGSGSAPDIDAWASDGGGATNTTDVLSGTFTVQIAFTNPNTSGTVRFDDIQLNGTLLGGPANNPPSFDADPINEVNATEDVAYSSTIADDASDPDSDPLTFSKVSGPAWLNVSTNGVLSGTPANSDVGANVFTVQVDAIDGTDTATLNITVIAAVRIVDGVTVLANDVLKMEVSGASPSASFCPASTTNLVNGAWGRIPHSDDGVNDFIVTNLTYSTTDGTNRFIYMQQGTNRIEFIRIQSVD